MDCGTEIRVHDKLTRGWSSEATRLPGLFTAGADVMSIWRGKKLDPCLTVHTKLTQNGCSETGRDWGLLPQGLYLDQHLLEQQRNYKGLIETACMGGWGQGMDSKTQKGQNTAADTKVSPAHRPCTQHQQRVGGPSKPPCRPSHPSAHTLTPFKGPARPIWE